MSISLGRTWMLPILLLVPAGCGGSDSSDDVRAQPAPRTTSSAAAEPSPTASPVVEPSAAPSPLSSVLSDDADCREWMNDVTPERMESSSGFLLLMRRDYRMPTEKQLDDHFIGLAAVCTSDPEKSLEQASIETYEMVPSLAE